MGWGTHQTTDSDGSSHNTVHWNDTNERCSWDNEGSGNITGDHHVDQNTDETTEFDDSYDSGNKGLGDNKYSI
jgi:hypothetical protein